MKEKQRKRDRSFKKKKRDRKLDAGESQQVDVYPRSLRSVKRLLDPYMKITKVDRQVPALGRLKLN